jgi:hypothetical protein
MRRCILVGKSGGASAQGSKNHKSHREVQNRLQEFDPTVATA